MVVAVDDGVHSSTKLSSATIFSPARMSNQYHRSDRADRQTAQLHPVESASPIRKRDLPLSTGVSKGQRPVESASPIRKRDLAPQVPLVPSLNWSNQHHRSESAICTKDEAARLAEHISRISITDPKARSGLDLKAQQFQLFDFQPASDSDLVFAIAKSLLTSSEEPKWFQRLPACERLRRFQCHRTARDYRRAPLPAFRHAKRGGRSSCR